MSSSGEPLEPAPGADASAPPSGSSPGRTGRLASLGLALVLLCLSGFAFWVALDAYRMSVRVTDATALSDAFEEACHAIGEAESLGRRYRVEPAPQLRAGQQLAAARTAAALQRAGARGTEKDRSRVTTLLALHDLYRDAVGRLFTAVDRGETERARVLDEEQVEPLFHRIQQRVEAAAEQHRGVARRRLEEFGRARRTMLLATPVVFAVGLGLLAVFWLALRGYQRGLDESRRREARAVRDSERRFRSLAQHTSDVILIADSAGRIHDHSPSAESRWGYDPSRLLNRPLEELVHPDDRPALRELLDQLRSVPAATSAIELRLRHAGDGWREVELTLSNLLHEPGIAGFVATGRDITERKTWEQQLRQRVFFDPLTELPNRALFQDRLAQALVRSERHRGRVAILCLDLDNFKVVNDSLGPAIGDRLLRQVAERLQRCVRREDTIARIGGDEFTVLLERVGSEDEAVELAERIASELGQPFGLEGYELAVTASVGIAAARGHHTRADSLIRDADVAMYRAKERGRARHVVFDASMRADAVARLDLERDLRRALREHELRLQYQPVFALASGELVELEALVRWQHPQQGLIPPATFIGLAEETGLILPLGRWVLREACRQLRAWEERYPSDPPLGVSVNLSPRQFEHPGLVADVESALEESGLAATSLKLEITEGVLMRETDVSIATLWQLKRLGVQVAVDDFGTGYSSLAYLKQLPLDVIKIDRSFVQRLGQDPEDLAIVQAIVSLARTLGLTVTGEGIETEEQAAQLRTLEVERGQGYLFARPLDAGAILPLLRAERWQSGVPNGTRRRGSARA